MLVEFFDEYRLAPMPLSSNSSTAYSYYQKSLQHYSLINYFCVSVDIAAVVSRVSTINVGNNKCTKHQFIHLLMATCND